MKRQVRLLLLCFFLSLISLGQVIASSNKTIYGYVEKVSIGPGNWVVKAKLDTGAVMASLDAIHIKVVKEKDERWVHFEIPRLEGNIKLKRKLVRFVRIKARNGEQKRGLFHTAIRRPVVNMELTIGRATQLIEVNLANRENFNYPLLLGRRPLVKFNVVVDPAKTFVSSLKES